MKDLVNLRKFKLEENNNTSELFPCIYYFLPHI